MKENTTPLYPDQETGEVVSNYSYEHSTNLPPYLIELHTEIKDREDSFYMISPLQQQFHIWFAKSVGAKRSKPHTAVQTLEIMVMGWRQEAVARRCLMLCPVDMGATWLAKQYSNEVLSRVILHLSF